MPTPDASGEVNILTSAIVQEDGRAVRFLFGVREIGGEVRSTIEKRDANTGEWLGEFRQNDSIVVTQLADIAKLKIGNYIFVPHTNAADTAHEDNGLAIEYIGE